MTTTRRTSLDLRIEALTNGQSGLWVVIAPRPNGQPITRTGNLTDVETRRRIANEIAAALGEDSAGILDELEKVWDEYDEGRRQNNPTTETPDQLDLTRLDDIKIRPVRWLVPGYLPRGKLTLIAGDGGWGKSLITLDLTACLTTGRPCLGLEYEPPPPCNVLLVTCEDDYEDTIIPRLAAAGANLSRVHRVNGLKTETEPSPFSLAHYKALARTLALNPGIRLVVIDPAGAFIGRTRIDDHKDSELRSLLGPLTETASKHDVTISLVKHFSKATNVGAVQRVMGGAGYVNAVRVALVVVPDQSDDNVRYLMPLKANIARKPAGRVYKIEPLDSLAASDLLSLNAQHLNETDRDELAKQLIKIHWLGSTNLKPEDALARPTGKQQANDQEEAAAWLKQFLTGQPRQSEECVTKGNEALKGGSKRLAWWRDTILKTNLQGKPRKTGFGDGQKWWFTLPDHPWPFPGLEEAAKGAGASSYSSDSSYSQQTPHEEYEESEEYEEVRDV